MNAPTLTTIFAERGYVGPFRIKNSEVLNVALSEAQSNVAELRERWRDSSDRTSYRKFCRNRHLRSPAFAQLARDPAIRQVLDEVYHQNLLLWRTNLFIQTGEERSKNPSTLGWHHDLYNRLLTPMESISVQIALTDSNEENCLLLVPGSHRWNTRELESHGLKKTTGFESIYGVPYYEPSPDVHPIERVTLKAGEFVVFDQALVHASSVADPNIRQEPRYAITLRLTRTDVRVLATAFEESPGDSCVLYSGNDGHRLNEVVGW